MGNPPRKARTPIAVLMDPTLRIFVMVLFFFHTANSSVLPLVMQRLALEDPLVGILLSGLCIVIAQACMSYFATFFMPETLPHYACPNQQTFTKKQRWSHHIQYPSCTTSKVGVVNQIVPGKIHLDCSVQKLQASERVELQHREWTPSPPQTNL